MTRFDRALLLCAVLGCLALALACAPALARVSTPSVATEAPRLSLRASPPLVFAGDHLMLIAELLGREDERYYCPGVIWTWPNATESGQESDCAPWPGPYERMWVMHVAAWPGEATYGVRLRKSGKDLLRASVTVTGR